MASSLGLTGTGPATHPYKVICECGLSTLILVGQTVICPNCLSSINLDVNGRLTLRAHQESGGKCPNCTRYVAALEQISARPPYPIAMRLSDEALHPPDGNQR